MHSVLPTCVTLLPVDTCPVIYHGEYLHDRKSKFQGHIAAVASEAEVTMSLGWFYFI